eukprot:CAMPEP_0168400504 /NCGR_PEP_ID=MMETSP0228-20121227/22632_1 /TAXON_ID=133427 /ORGANISM="Protoceratium reticulatum, Strain CCCM 535 (=CCMP 1889)" /LENGTH=316 /DNA_ID=CAMNT_0008414047 /DNA_START=268 /DNA_END=1215 /DNA_ORIENTATION=-
MEGRHGLWRGLFPAPVKAGGEMPAHHPPSEESQPAPIQRIPAAQLLSSRSRFSASIQLRDGRLRCRAPELVEFALADNHLVANGGVGGVRKGAHGFRYARAGLGAPGLRHEHSLPGRADAEVRGLRTLRSRPQAVRRAEEPLPALLGLGPLRDGAHQRRLRGPLPRRPLCQPWAAQGHRPRRAGRRGAGRVLQAEPLHPAAQRLLLGLGPVPVPARALLGLDLQSPDVLELPLGVLPRPDEHVGLVAGAEQVALEPELKPANPRLHGAVRRRRRRVAPEQRATGSAPQRGPEARGHGARRHGARGQAGVRLPRTPA